MSEKKVVQLGWKEFIAYAEYVLAICVWNPRSAFLSLFRRRGPPFPGHSSEKLWGAY